ncbi:L-tyrosine 3-hydroxylase [Streptomyces sp. NBC_01142]|uniref:L-tyrosine 3-hydroxylase n=1 Tax=Streptomyces sp. NBC_01142 TaxID=2975865 RepID=UPI0022527239|nr:L-tyrosine 3-hydroxylase [Streptomyces sp. NBC_01142]MCX4820189.1 L-tyrosine 3-hydroxylase [Streptomyces sp. NBC_01142]
MNLSDNRALSTDVPTAGRWVFGGHLYGLEPLALPTEFLNRNADDDPRHETEDDPPESGDSLLHYEQAMGADLVPHDESEVERLFWFRWITGHQTTFAVWQLLSAILEEGKRPGADSDELARLARCMVRTYSLMLLYASSPPQEMYERVIRDPMARQHPNLSGAWARDYTGVRPLIRGKSSLGSEAAAADLAFECDLNERIHKGIAARVVPSGVSLLLTPGVRQKTRELRRETLLWLYDGIFLTTRMPVSYATVVRQLIRRIHAIHLDVSANGLYPACARNTAPEPAELSTDDVLELKASFTSTLRELAALVSAPAFTSGCESR